MHGDFASAADSKLHVFQHMHTHILVLTHTHTLIHLHLHTTQHKTRALVSTTKGTQHLAGEIRSASDLDFYVDGVSFFASDHVHHVALGLFWIYCNRRCST